MLNWFFPKTKRKQHFNIKNTKGIYWGYWRALLFCYDFYVCFLTFRIEKSNKNNTTILFVCLVGCLLLCHGSINNIDIFVLYPFCMPFLVMHGPLIIDINSCMIFLNCTVSFVDTAVFVALVNFSLLLYPVAPHQLPSVILFCYSFFHPSLCFLVSECLRICM